MRILTGKFRGRVIRPPEGKHFRPTSGKSREGCFSHVGEKVMDAAFLDLFAGSGTTVVAAERTGRVGLAMELDPRYCDVVRRRWAERVHSAACDWEALTPELSD